MVCSTADALQMLLNAIAIYEKHSERVFYVQNVSAKAKQRMFYIHTIKRQTLLARLLFYDGDGLRKFYTRIYTRMIL